MKILRTLLKTRLLFICSFLIVSSIPISNLSGQTSIDIEGNSNVGVPHFSITEIGQDFTRMTFKNTFQPGKFWTIAAEPQATPDISRLNFFYNDGTIGLDRFTVTGAGSVGINTTNPQANLHVIGSARISQLGGSGTRPIYADDSGNLVTSPSRYLSLSPTAFHPSRDNNDVNWVSGYTGAWIEGSKAMPRSTYLVAPINLPHGSTVTKITVYYIDDDPEMVTFRMGYYDTSSNNFGFFFTENSSGNSSSDNSKEINNLNINIDNINRSYHFVMGVCFVMDCTPSLTSDFRIKQVLIEYTE